MKKQLYLVGVDGSEWSNRALQRAMNLAEQTGASVKLVYVLDWSRIQPVIIEGVIPPSLSMEDEEKYANENVILPIIEQYKDYSTDLNSELIWGDPVEILHDQVKETHANMLFVGRRGRSRFRDLLLGSVANKLAHCIGIPVVLVP